MTGHPLSQRITAVLDLAPGAFAVEYDGHWSSYGDLATLARRIAAVVDGRGQVGTQRRV
jgi:long-chain acyl-CoA synthetase